MLSIASAIASIFGFLRDLFGYKQRAEDRQAGRNEVTAKVNSETVETKNAMEDVARPSDDAVADSLRDRKF